MNRYITPHTAAELELSGQDLFPNSEQSVKSLEIFRESIISPLLDFSIGVVVPLADLVFTSFREILNPNVRIQNKVKSMTSIIREMQ